MGRSRGTSWGITVCGILCVALSVGAAAARPAESPDDDPLPVELLQPHTTWYGLYAMGFKVGWARLSLSRVDDGGAPCWAHELAMEIGSDEEDDLSTSLIREVFEAAPPYRFRSLAVDEDDDLRVRVIQEDGLLTIVVQDEDGTRVEERPAVDHTLGDLLRPFAWAHASGRAIGDSLDTSSLDSETFEMTEGRSVVTALGRDVLGREHRPWVELSVTQEGLGLVGLVIRVDRQGRLLSMTMGALMELRREPEVVARDVDRAGIAWPAPDATLDRPLGDVSTIERLVLTTDVPLARHIPGTPRQVVALDAESDVTRVTLLAGAGEPAAATPGEMMAALESTEEHPADDAAVRALALEAVADAVTPAQRVERLIAFVDAHLEADDAFVPESLAEVLEARRGNCDESAQLFVALARAVGIPAREVGGLIYAGDEEPGLVGHAWCEVVLGERWIPVDPEWGEGRVNATHLRLETDDGNPFFDALGGLWGLSFEVQEIMRAEQG